MVRFQNIFWKASVALVVVATSFFTTSSIQAQENQEISSEEAFDTALTTTYRIDETGNTRVTQSFTITNKTPLYTITKYGMTFTSTDITEVQVRSDGQPINPEVVTTETQTSVGITFPDQIVGEGKARELEISYLDGSAASVLGQVLEVAVPKLEDPSVYSQYQVELITPARFGEPSRVTPTADAINSSDTTVTTRFSAPQGASIVAIYGQEQLFDLETTYHLQNPTNQIGITQIALPPDTTYQRVTYTKLDPKPDDVTRDTDGNWIATYTLDAGANLDVVANFQAHLSLEPFTEVPVTQPAPEFTLGQEYWDINHSLVRTTANQYTTPREIYTFLVDTFSYNYDRLQGDISRLGAVQALEKPNLALCQEYTDAFVALARSNQIPSRRVTGYAHTENEQLRPLSYVEDILHAWAEFYNYDTKIWQPVDPTWGSTSGGINYFDQFDLNHIAFSINGKSSQLPYPAGSYKSVDDLSSKDVVVNFSNRKFITDPAFEMELRTPLVGSVPVPQPHQLIITNETGQAWYNQDITLQGDGFAEITILEEKSIEALLPFQSVSRKVWIITPNLTPQETVVTVTYGNQTKTITTTAIPGYWLWLSHPYVVIGLGLSSILIAFSAWGVLVFIRRRRAIRGQSQES